MMVTLPPYLLFKKGGESPLPFDIITMKMP